MIEMDTYEKKYNDLVNDLKELWNCHTNDGQLLGELAEICPELRESEDERIRKEIISALKFANDDGVYDKHIAYLEKHKESLHISETCKENADSFTDACKDVIVAIEKYLDWLTGYPDYAPKGKYSLRDMLYCLSLLEKPKEQKPLSPDEKMNHSLFLEGFDVGREVGKVEAKQKPAEWSEEDSIGWDEAFACVTRAEKAAKNEEELQNAVIAEKWLKEIKFKYYVHPVKQECGEENKNGMLSNIIMAIRAFYKCEREDLVDYVKSLRPVNPAEWSEEDEKIITRLIGYFESFRIAGVTTKWEGLDLQEVITLLKSLRPQPKRDCKDCAMFLNGKCTKPHWKPSEEQMAALRNSLDYLSVDEYDDILELYEQLKELM